LLTRVYVDFHAVEEKHRDIDARLVNWARWSLGRLDRGGSYPATAAGFEGYRPPATIHRHVEAPNPVDSIAAVHMQAAVVALPVKHRLATHWHYIRRNNPRRAAQDLAVTLAGLAELVRDARQMLINRGY
jgi:hypothetical protein